MPDDDMAALIADDYLAFDGVQTVTLRTLAGDSVTVEGTTSGPVGYKQMAMIAGLVTEERTLAFSLPRATCGGLVPERNATIVDEDGIAWKILNVENKTLRTRFSCACVISKATDSTPLPPVELADNSTVSGNGLLKLTWTNRNAGDASAVTAAVQYSLLSDFGSPTNLSVGTITLATITYQSPTAVAAGTYYVRVRHTNAKGDSPWSNVVTITVPAVLAFTSSASPTLAENTQAVVTATAGGGRAPYVFTIVDGADAALLTITSPNVTFLVAPDFDLPGDADLDNAYEFTLRVTDADANTVDQNVVATVTDVGD